MARRSSPASLALVAASLAALGAVASGCNNSLGEECSSDRDCMPPSDTCIEVTCDRTEAEPFQFRCAGHRIDSPRCTDARGDASMTLDTSGSDAPGLDAPVVDASDVDAPASGVLACTTLPRHLVDAANDAPGVYDPAGVLCGVPLPSGAGGGGGSDFSSCFLTTTVFLPGPSDPPDPTSCATADTILELATDASGALVARAGSVWRWIAASVPVDAGYSRATLSPGVEATLVLVHEPTDVWVEVVLVATDGDWELRGIRRHTGALPHFGVAYACGGEERTYDVVTTSGTFDAYARVCEPGEYGLCTVHAAVETSPEVELCTTGYALELDWAPGPPRVPLARCIIGAAYSFETSSHGTLGSRSVTDIPLDTDVTMTASNGSTTIEVVARWPASGDRVVASVRRL